MIRYEKSIKEPIDKLSELSEISKVSGVKVNPQKETIEICMAVLFIILQSQETTQMPINR